jgi:hypothetical protein
MGMFSPEFSAFWLGESEQAQPVERRTSGAQSGDEGLSPSQQVALEELAERVNAARSVI